MPWNYRDTEARLSWPVLAAGGWLRAVRARYFRFGSAGEAVKVVTLLATVGMRSVVLIDDLGCSLDAGICILAGLPTSEGP